MTMNRRTRVGFSRRHLLKTLGASAALSPFLPLLNATGQEGAGTFPKRLLLFFSPDGTASIDDGGRLVEWRPTGTETDFQLQATHEPLSAVKSRLVVPYGLRMTAGGAGQEHAFGMAGLWTAASLHPPHDGFDFDGGNGQRTGWGSGASVDQYLATRFGPNMPYERALDDAAPETPYRTLELGAQCSDPHSMHRMIYKGDKEPIHPEVNPKAAYDRLFANLNVDAGTPATPDPSLGLKQSAMDILIGDIERLKTKVGSEDYRKVDAHLEGLRAIERRFETATPTPSAGCTLPDVPPEATSRWENSAAFPGEATAMMDLAVHALACDLTRIASVQLSRGFSNIVHEWFGHTQGHHTVSHLEGDHTSELLQIDQWYAEQFAYLINKLDSIVEGNGTMLDNTLVVWGREMGQTNHRMQPVNLILAGGARGSLTTGRYLDFNNEPHAKLLVSICRLMGADDVNSFGNRDLDTGPLAGV